MSSSSPRVGLTIMADSDFVNPFTVSGNSSKMDTMTSLTQCTSTTRPATPFDGMHIYETDMQVIRRWSQADGKWYIRGGSGVNNATGFVAQFSDSATHTLPGTTGPSNLQIISLHDYNLTLQNGHTYRINEQGWFNLSGTWSSSTNFTIPEFFTVAGVGSNPPLSDAGSLHYFYQPYEQNFNANRKPYYKTFYYTVPGAVGIGNTSNVFFRSLMRVDTTLYPTNTSLGRPTTSFPARAFVYDMGVNGAN